ncbi:MAG: sensor histidine kinase [Anaerolineales bacterium]
MIWSIWYAAKLFFPGTFLEAKLWPPAFWFLWGLAWGSLGVYVQIHRYRYVFDSTQRQQAKWAVFGWIIVFPALVVNYLPYVLYPNIAQAPISYLLYQTAAYVLMLLTLPILPITIVFSVLKFRLWDIDPVLSNSLVYGLLTIGVLGVYMVIVGGLGALLQMAGSFWISLFAAGVVAALFQPLRAWLQRRVNHMLYGQRDEPYEVLSQLGHDLQAARDADTVVNTIAGTVARALKLPYAALRLKRGEIMETVAATGTPADGIVTFPVRYQAEVLGELLVAPRAPGESFNRTERRLLEDIAQQAGVAAHTLRLNVELQQALERTVLAREAERRTLRRDLHDHLAPALSGLMLKMDAIRNFVGNDDSAAQRMLGELRQQTQTAVGEIRTLAYNLRPPALDDLGLVAAIREVASQLSTPTLPLPEGEGRGEGEPQSLNGVWPPKFLVTAQQPLPPLPAAVEAAAYRIAVEALANVARHARARHCWVTLAIHEPRALTLTIEDDGVGFPNEYRAGVGITAMRERASELGGALTLAPRTGGGVIVAASLPIKPEPKPATDLVSHAPLPLPFQGRGWRCRRREATRHRGG